MGLSCYLCYKPSFSFQSIRVVHLNGFVEDFNYPIMVSELTGTQAKHFVCTPTQLLSFKSSKTLPADTELQPGQVYFLLPFSVFQSDTSPVDLVYLSKRLSTVAKRVKSPKAKVNRFQPSKESCSASTPERVGSPSFEQVGSFVALESVLEAFGDEVSCRSKSWKPILETIIEKSFGRRSDFSHLSDSFRQMEFRV